MGKYRIEFSPLMPKNELKKWSTELGDPQEEWYSRGHYTKEGIKDNLGEQVKSIEISEDRDFWHVVRQHRIYFTEVDNLSQVVDMLLMHPTWSLMFLTSRGCLYMWDGS